MDMHEVSPNVIVRIIWVLGVSLLFLMVQVPWTKMKSFLLVASPLDGAMWEKKIPEEKCLSNLGHLGICSIRPYPLQRHLCGVIIIIHDNSSYYFLSTCYVQEFLYVTQFM